MGEQIKLKEKPDGFLEPRMGTLSLLGFGTGLIFHAMNPEFGKSQSEPPHIQKAYLRLKM